eukprot:Nk52_evm18s225 gene=Nk52_evmTU18s225
MNFILRVLVILLLSMSSCLANTLLPCPGYTTGSAGIAYFVNCECAQVTKCRGTFTLHVWGPGGDSHMTEIVSLNRDHTSRKTGYLSNAHYHIPSGQVHNIADPGANTKEIFVTLVGIATAGCEDCGDNAGAPFSTGTSRDCARTRYVNFNNGRANMGRISAFTGEVFFTGPLVADHAHFLLGTDGNGKMSGGGNYLVKGGTHNYNLASISVYNDDKGNLIVSNIKKSSGTLKMTVLGAGPQIDNHNDGKISGLTYTGIRVIPQFNGNVYAYFDVPLPNRALTAQIYLASRHNTNNNVATCYSHQAVFRISTSMTDSGDNQYGQFIYGNYRLPGDAKYISYTYDGSFNNDGSKNTMSVRVFKKFLRFYVYHETGIYCVNNMVVDAKYVY